MTAAFKKRKVDPERILSAARQSLSLAVDDLSQYKIGQVYEVPLARIKPNPANARALYPAAAAQELARSFENHGQTTAATGFVTDTGDVVLIDGHRRLKACELAQNIALRIEIRPRLDSEQGLYLASRAANVERAEQTPLDDALVWRRLLDRKVFPSQQSLSKALGLSETQVSRTLALVELPAGLTQQLAEKPELLNLKMLTALREYYKDQGEDKTLVLILEVSKEGLSYRDVEERRKSLRQGPKPRMRSVRANIQYNGASGVLRSFEKVGRVELTLKGLTAEDLKGVVKRLEAALQPQ